MPIDQYSGETFVSFMDISGFKELMKVDKAIKALDKLYSTGYKLIHDPSNNNSRVEGIFISDCGVLFVRNVRNDETCNINNLRSLLHFIKKINHEMIRENYMLTTSIAYGEFSYHGRIEFQGIEKNPIYGSAYVSAYLDNEKGVPKIQPGQCRIVKNNLPQDIQSKLNDNCQDDIYNLIKKRAEDKKNYYFYWMVNSPSEIDEFERAYKNSYNLKFEGMLKAIKGGGPPDRNMRF